jgi:hypothetical protein
MIQTRILANNFPKKVRILPPPMKIVFLRAVVRMAFQRKYGCFVGHELREFEHRKPPSEDFAVWVDLVC